MRRLDLVSGKVEIAETLAEVPGHGLLTGTTKTGKVRTLPIPRFLCAELEALIEGKAAGDYVFTSPDGGPLRHNNLYNRDFKPAVRAAGLPASVRFHDLRHSFLGF